MNKHTCNKCGAVRIDDQIGLEKTPELFVAKMVKVFNEVYRVTKDTGVLWLNLGDSYWGGKGSNGNSKARRTAKERGHKQSPGTPLQDNRALDGNHSNIKPKDLVGIPWMVAFALRKAGWYLRQDIIWQKPNPMPESVTDRCSKSHEYLFLFSKSNQYYFDQDAIRVPLKDAAIARLAQDIANQKGSDRAVGKTNGTMKAVVKNHKIGGAEKYQNGDIKNRTKSGKDWEPRMAGSGLLNKEGRSGYFRNGELLVGPTANKKSVWEETEDFATWKWMFANLPEDVVVPLFEKFVSETMLKGDVWEIATMPFKEAHFATFPEKLPVTCIKAGSSEYGCCADCGNPWERISEKKLVPTDCASFNTKPDDRDHQADSNDQGSNRVKSGHKPGWANEVNTLGWQPTCNCHGEVKRISLHDYTNNPESEETFANVYISKIPLEEHPVKPAVVLDCFSGAGTTLLVARKLGRDYIGCELKPEYIVLTNMMSKCYPQRQLAIA